eukprot:TRINITY_DN12928_c0_g1_i14.p1 TRINITY_DN12928_c0_g1~~TRINITY_DN12928_c0_g1_i14.p1  ORF type:complete len:221 (+),score=41.49 TRINITY_DN12928_c0_g1_i14:73-735(+)
MCIRDRYKRPQLRVLSSAKIPKRTIEYLDTKQNEKQRAGECLAIKLAEKLMGVDKEEPEFIVSHVNLKNQPHQRFYADGRNKGASATPMIYKTWSIPEGRRPAGARRVSMPPGPLNVQYSAKSSANSIQQSNLIPRLQSQPPRFRCLPPEYDPSPPIEYGKQMARERVAQTAAKRELDESVETGQSEKRGKYESERLKEAKAALQLFLNMKQTAKDSCDN